MGSTLHPDPSTTSSEATGPLDPEAASCMSPLDHLSISQVLPHRPHLDLVQWFSTGSILPRPCSPPRGGGHLPTSGDDVDRHKWGIQWVETRDATKHLTWHRVTGPTTKNDPVVSVSWVSITSVAKPLVHVISSCLAPLQTSLHDGAAGLRVRVLFASFCVSVCVFLSLCLWHRHSRRQGRGHTPSVLLTFTDKGV